ncbi:MAG: glycine cleavage system aminomethyltransferase GcvT [Mucinivorans sp.]
MKTTAFTHHHIAAGAKMAEFAGFNMPIEFSGIAHEHMAVREAVGIFDVSHMGEIWVKGPSALAFLQHVTTNDVATLYDGKIQYSCFPNGKGGIVDDLLIYRVNQDTYLLVVNASNVDKDYAHLAAHCAPFGITPGRELYNASDEIAQVAIQGPLAMALVQKICAQPIMDMEYYTFAKVTLAGIPNVILSATGYTGSGGCEIYVANQDAEKLWDAIWEVGAEFGLENIGLGARDTLRLEMGFCLYGNDIDETTSPIEAGLGWITKFVDGKDFIDRATMEAIKAAPIVRRLVGIELRDRGIARHGYPICTADGQRIGTVTSGTQGPGIKKAIAMGYVDAPFHKVGSQVYIEVRGKLLLSEVVKMPFYKK